MKGWRRETTTAGEECCQNMCLTAARSSAFTPRIDLFFFYFPLSCSGREALLLPPLDVSQKAVDDPLSKGNGGSQNVS